MANRAGPSNSGCCLFCLPAQGDVAASAENLHLGQGKYLFLSRQLNTDDAPHGRRIVGWGDGGREARDHKIAVGY
jgi:hypothetical protein